MLENLIFKCCGAVPPFVARTVAEKRGGSSSVPVVGNLKSFLIFTLLKLKKDSNLSIFEVQGKLT